MDCKSDCTDGYHNLGLMYARGRGVQQNYAEAVSEIAKAADRGQMYAQYDLGGMYYNGQGVAKNYAEAMKWFLQGGRPGRSTPSMASASCMTTTMRV